MCFVVLMRNRLFARKVDCHGPFGLSQVKTVQVTKISIIIVLEIGKSLYSILLHNQVIKYLS